MNKSRLFLATLVLAVSGLLVRAGALPGPAGPEGARQAAAAPGLEVRFTFTDQVSTVPVSGRIILGFHGNLSKPINNPDLFDPQPTFAWDVRDWKPGEPLVLDGSGAAAWHGDLDALDGWYGVQAALKTNRRARSLRAEGNAVTAKSVVYIERGKMCRPVDLLFNIAAGGERAFGETDAVKEITVPSELLSRFHGTPERLQAAVILPASYSAEKDRRYPTVYVMGGWGSSRHDALTGFPQKRYGMSGFGEEKVFVFLEHACGSGYHVFCGSETNGPLEEALLGELIPWIERTYRVDADPRARFLMGQSSGAWGSLWLLISHPDRFGGAYVGSPDPVDFTDFIGTDIYAAGANVYYGPDGELKRFASGANPRGPLASLTIKDFVGLDRIAGWGEQMYSFDAAFSPKGPGGEPLRLFDWDTGRVDPAVAASWKKHDLSLAVSRLDRRKSDLLQDKIRVCVADDDDFGLNRPVHAFRDALARKGIRADIRFPAGGGHDVWTNELRTAIHEDIDRKCRSIGRRRP